MRIQLTERFQQDFAALSGDERMRLFSVMLKIPTALKAPHLHGGMGLRKLHPSGIFEARLGLSLRLVFGVESGSVILHRVGTHDEIQRYLKSL